jgi:hypothetical protein
MTPFAFSTNMPSALGTKLTKTHGCKSRTTRAVAGRSEPSLAGVAVTRGLKRRQGSCGVRVVSPESWKVVEAETVLFVEGRVCAVAKRDGDASPGSWTASRAKGQRRNPGGPAGTVGLVTNGGEARGRTEVPRRAEAGSRIDPYY